MEKPFFTLVMPVYGVEHFLERAVKSVLDQTFTDFELILINDASIDKSGELCDVLAKTDSRIKVLHLAKNVGISNVRNIGLSEASGSYIFFPDSDDFIDLDTLRLVSESLEQNLAKVVVWGVCVENYGVKNEWLSSVEDSYPAQRCKTKEEVRSHIMRLEMKTLFGYPCNKFYEVTYLRENGFQFPPGQLLEDFFFNATVFKNIDSMNVLSNVLYFYQKRTAQNLTARYMPEYYDVHMAKISKLIELHKGWGIYTNEIKGEIANIYIRYVISTLQRNYDKKSGMSSKEQKQWLVTLYGSYLYSELIECVSTDNMLVKFLSGFLRRKQTNLSFLSGKGIHFVKNKLPKLFAKAKQNK